MKRHRQRICILVLLICLLSQAGAAAASSYETLRPGMSGEPVRALQQGLEFLGFSLGVDGKYGPQTEQAVLAFQRRENLEADGLAGRLTLTALYRLATAFDPGTGLPAVQTPAAPQAPTVPVFEQASNSYEATVYTSNRGSLNLRIRPSHGNTTIAQLPFGTRVLVMAATGTWSQVSALGQIGYVQSSYLRKGAEAPLPNPSQAPAATQQPQTPQDVPVGAAGEARVVTQNRGSLNLRDSASYSGRVMRTIPYQASVLVLNRLLPWAQVQYQGQTGYVVDSFLVHGSAAVSTPQASQQPAPQATPPLQKAEGVAYVNTMNGRTLNFRSEPREADNIIGQLPYGAALLLLSRGDTWCEVAYNGRQGFVMASFLRFAETTPLPTATPSPVPGEAETAAPPALEDEPAVFPRVLRPGYTGEDVKELQSRLIDLKYTLSLNGTYDGATQEAVRSFQLQNSLEADGLFGSQSAAVLLSGAARAADSAPLSYKTLRIDNRDSTEPHIAAMQEALKNLGYPLSVNGRFDVPTHQAVVGFQVRNGLPITGIANPLTQSTLYSAGAKGYSAPAPELDASQGKIGGPSTGSVKLLHWFKDIKPRFAAGQTVTIYHPSSGISFNIRFYSLGNHADSEPATWRDTQLMNRAFGEPSWNINTVYVKLPDGTWTLAAMHNRPHLTGAVSANGFGGHLCIHFLRDMDEVLRNDPDYGASNQRAIRKAWQGMTGEIIE